jgi:hypothetical protein
MGRPQPFNTVFQRAKPAVTNAHPLVIDSYRNGIRGVMQDDLGFVLFVAWLHLTVIEAAVEDDYTAGSVTHNSPLYWNGTMILLPPAKLIRPSRKAFSFAD